MDKKWADMTREEQIAAVNASFEKVRSEVIERCNYRAKNYYDCIDDYSEYGPCYKADMAELHSAEKYRDIRLAEIDNNGVHRETTKRYVLLDSESKVVADEIYNGTYGKYWYDYINGCNVRVPNKISTLNKKGYTLALIEKSYNCTAKLVSMNLNIVNWAMELVDTKVTILNKMPEYIPTGVPYPDLQYNNFFKQTT